VVRCGAGRGNARQGGVKQVPVERKRAETCNAAGLGSPLQQRQGSGCGEVLSTECVPVLYYGRLRRQLLAPSAHQTPRHTLPENEDVAVAAAVAAMRSIDAVNLVLLRAYRFDIWPGCSSPLTDCNTSARTARDGLSWTVWDAISTHMRSLLLAGWTVPRRPCWRTTGSRAPTTVARTPLRRRARPMQTTDRGFSAPAKKSKADLGIGESG
jgi:hypothetical protein